MATYVWCWKAKENEDAAQKGKNNFINLMGSLFWKKSLGVPGSIPCSPVLLVGLMMVSCHWFQWAFQRRSCCPRIVDTDNLILLMWSEGHCIKHKFNVTNFEEVLTCLWAHQDGDSQIQDQLGSYTQHGHPPALGVYAKAETWRPTWRPSSLRSGKNWEPLIQESGKEWEPLIQE